MQTTEKTLEQPSNMNFPDEYFRRYDESDDSNFYVYPRKVVHIDDGAIGTLRATYADLLPNNGIILDLMSSWRSHYPDDLNSTRVDALGMNAEEMADNPQLDNHIVHNLNQNPILPYESNVYHAVTCAVSVQYLTNPVKVFAEVNRVLRKDGVFVVSFSNRCFPTKAVAVWTSMNDLQHVALVTGYFEASGNWRDINTAIHNQDNHDPLFVVWGYKAN